MDEFWGIDSETGLRAVGVYITKLRDKFAACDGFQIITVRGLDYKYEYKEIAVSALTVGIIGTVLMARSTFAVTAAPPLIGLCVLLAIPGFIGWAAPYFLYRTFVKNRAAIVTSLIEEKQNEIYELC